MTVVTRFAPSPTGYLHIGGARTALFNWLYARHNGGLFQLRIEDTDRARSTDAAIAAILDGLSWLGITWDGGVVYQFSRSARHVEVANALLESGQAYRCYATPEELDAMRNEQRAAGKTIRYDSRWRDCDPAKLPKDENVPFVIRLRAPTAGKTVVEDLVQGEVTVANNQLDDMVLLRADGTPTYMHAVVVDDHDMGITHVIRGDDHLTNSFRQIQLYRACGWKIPRFAHIPLIHGSDGKKLSKRHGALGIDTYRELGYLPSALANYLLRLGWSHGDAEIISQEQAIEWFDLNAVGRSPARFDFTKLNNLNSHYIRSSDDFTLAQEVAAQLDPTPNTDEKKRITALMPELKGRAKTLVELSKSATFLTAKHPIVLEPKAADLLTEENIAILQQTIPVLTEIATWDSETLEEAVRSWAKKKELRLKDVAQILRIALTGSTISPPVFSVLSALGPEETMVRIKNIAYRCEKEI